MSVTIRPRISFCTNCMGRLSHIQQTLIKNVKIGADPVKYEFVLLNYNSLDGLDQWVRRELTEPIKAGLLSYYHTTRPQGYAMPHAKNVAHLLAQGPIVCNLDGDNFITPQFLHFIEEVFVEHESGVVVGFHGSGIGSRIAMNKEDFVRLGGYDEEMGRGWGPDDADLQMRALRSGLRMVTNVNIRFFGKEIAHPDTTRNEMTALKLPKNESERLNKDLLIENARKGVTRANAGETWGLEIVRRNFEAGLLQCAAKDSLTMTSLNGEAGG